MSKYSPVESLITIQVIKKSTMCRQSRKHVSLAVGFLKFSTQ